MLKKGFLVNLYWLVHSFATYAYICRGIQSSKLETLLRISKFKIETYKNKRFPATLSAENFEIMVQIKPNKVTENVSGS